jgi:hypothetical protein
MSERDGVRAAAEALAERMDRIASPDFDGYLHRPIPDERDNLVRFLVTVAVRSEGIGDAIVRRSTDRHAAAFRAFAERMASHGLRLGAPDVLGDAAGALSLAYAAGDAREALLIVPLVARSAERLKIDHDIVIDRAVDDIARSYRHTIEMGAARRLKEMGYHEIVSHEGLAYARDW